jgi:transposase InsO family protein
MASCFTSLDFTDLLKDNGIQVSMDGKRCWQDNVFVERLWKSVKYEEVYACLRLRQRCQKGAGEILCQCNQPTPVILADDGITLPITHSRLLVNDFRTFINADTVLDYTSPALDRCHNACGAVSDETTSHSTRETQINSVMAHEIHSGRFPNRGITTK